MKRFLILALALVLMLTFVVACNDKTPEVPDNNDDKTEQPDDQNQQPGDPDDKTEEPTQPAKVTYTITVKDQDGNPIADVEAQICVDGVCKKPNVTNENGVVTFTMDDPGESVLSLQINEGGSPAGYEYPTDKIAIEAGQTEVTVTLNKKAQ
ncbi:MAG: Ig-like domain-containing protein [Clostridia bacterium]|nr:Ig-like domain-containing protein [Clostridia bacterium]